jgi:hypothetical protein
MKAAIGVSEVEKQAARAGRMHDVRQIRDRAYEIYLQRGAQPGHELEDWLQAERELTTKIALSSP